MTLFPALQVSTWSVDHFILKQGLSLLPGGVLVFHSLVPDLHLDGVVTFGVDKDIGPAVTNPLDSRNSGYQIQP